MAWNTGEKRRKRREREREKERSYSKPLDNGEDIFSNEPRRVHSSANYTSTAFSVFRSTWLLSFQSQRNVGADGGARQRENGRTPGNGSAERSMLSLSLSLFLPPSLFLSNKAWETRNPPEEISQTINSKTNLKTKKLRWSASDAENSFLSRWMPTSLHRRGAGAPCRGGDFRQRSRERSMDYFPLWRVVRRFCTSSNQVERMFLLDTVNESEIDGQGVATLLWTGRDILWFQTIQSKNYVFSMYFFQRLC